MKSKFLGLNAKLALAILAVGTMFTSCYDSENGDVTVPYKAPDAMYSFVGTVTNNITGAAVQGATVTLSGLGFTGTAVTDANGGYQIVQSVDGGTAAGTVTVAVAAGTGYEAVSMPIEVIKIGNGQAVTYYKNMVVNYTAFLEDGLKVQIDANTAGEDVILSGEDGPESVPGLDIKNETDEPLLVKRNFIVATGIKVTEQSPIVYDFTATKAIPEGTLAAVKEYINGDLGGTAPTKEFGQETRPFDILVAPMTALKNVTISYLFELKTYNFTYNGENILVKVKRVVSVAFDYTETSLSHYHGHGHGHGHGGDLNAGGGLFE